VADDRVAAAVAELYGADPDAFTERRKALVAAAREAGDKRSAAAITALRKPTRAAWLVNRLARSEPDAPARLAEVAAELRAAERAKNGPRLRELSAERSSLIDALTDRALRGAGTPDAPASLRAEVTATLTAAMADQGTAAGFAAGTLTKAAQWSGFGYADIAPADGAAPDESRSPTAPDPAPVDIATRRSARARTAADSGSGAGRAPLATPDDRSAPSPAAPPRPIRLPKQASRPERDRADAGLSAEADTARTSARPSAQRTAQERRRRADEAEQRRLAAAAEQRELAAEAEAERRARESAERAARARAKYQDAERTVAQASAAAAEAAAVEDRLEAEVRQLEERLTQAREELAAARLRARRAESAERRARQTLDQLPRP
jgi:hypothetical protein